MSVQSFVPSHHLNLASDPLVLDSRVGDVYYNTTLGRLRCLADNGTVGWQNVTPADAVAGLNGVTGIWTGTQAEYNAISSPVSTVVYVIT